MIKKDYNYYKFFGAYETQPLWMKFVFCWFFGTLGYQHVMCKDWLGLILHHVAFWLFIAIPSLLTVVIGTLLAETTTLNVVIFMALFVIAQLYCTAIMHRIMYYYLEAVEEDSEYFFEQLANKKSWPLINRLLVIIPKNLRR